MRAWSLKKCKAIIDGSDLIFTPSANNPSATLGNMEYPQKGTRQCRAYVSYVISLLHSYNFQLSRGFPKSTEGYHQQVPQSLIGHLKKACLASKESTTTCIISEIKLNILIGNKMAEPILSELERALLMNEVNSSSSPNTMMDARKRKL